MGPSGSGKSTLLHLIAGLDRPDSGTLTVGAQDVSALSDRGMAELRNESIGIVFQAFHLLDHLTVVENVALPAFFGRQATSTAARHQRATEVLDRVGLGGLEDSHPDRLSGGQRQRVAIARSLYHRPALLLADEPTGNLDTVTGIEVLDLFRQLNEEDGTAFVIVTHEQRVCDHADRTVHLQDGTVRAS